MFARTRSTKSNTVLAAVEALSFAVCFVQVVLLVAAVA